VAELDAKTRAQLPDSAFAYIDSKGKRRLPIHDASHVRNALSRFNQCHFEDDDARDRARIRLLRAAQKHGVVPIGFLRAQLRPQLRLPTGHVTFLLTDVEGSTRLLAELGDGYADLIRDLRRVLRTEVKRAGGHEVDVRADEHFSVFESAAAALRAALAAQRALPPNVRVRVALHSGRPTLTDTGYVGLAVHAAARFCYAAHGGQIVVSHAARAAIGDELPDGVALRTLGAFRFEGFRDPEELFQVEAAGLERSFPPLRAGRAVSR
jgi:class 3 adenylate cyclase